MKQLSVSLRKYRVSQDPPCCTILILGNRKTNRSLKTTFKENKKIERLMLKMQSKVEIIITSLGGTIEQQKLYASKENLNSRNDI